MSLTIGIAFLAGLVSFLSPCMLPLVPAFLSYLVGTNQRLKDQRLKIFLNSIFFVLGFVVIFTLLGITLKSVLINISFTLRNSFAKIAGLIIIFFGLYLLGIINPPFLNKEHKFKFKTKYTYLSSFLFGTFFALGWTPCIGAILGSVLTLAVVDPTNATFLLFAYSLGLGLPFLLVGMFTGEAYNLISRYNHLLKYFSIFIGIILLVLGTLLFVNGLSSFSTFEFTNYLLNKYS